MIARAKKIIKEHVREGTALFRILSLISGVLESRSKLFSLKEVLLYPIYGQTYLDKEYYDYLKRLSRHLKGKTVTIVDVGANRGWFVRLAPRFFKFDQIFAYEPVEHPSLTSLQGKVPGLTIRKALLGKGTERKQFYKYGCDGLSSIMPLNPDFYFPENFDRNLEEKVEMSSISLAQDLKSFNSNIVSPIVMKMDTQGAELEILEGARELFEKGMISAVIVELIVQPMYEGQYSWLKIVEFFDSYNFDILDMIVGLRQPDESVSVFEGIFVKRVAD